MQINDLITHVQTNLNKTITAGSKVFQNSDVIGWANEGIASYWSFVFGRPGSITAPNRDVDEFRNYYKLGPVSLVIANDNKVALPSDCQRIWRLSPVLVGGSYVLPKFWVSVITATSTGTRYAYFERTITGTVTAGLYYYRRPLTMTATTDDIDMPVPHQFKLVDWTTLRGLSRLGIQKEGNLAAYGQAFQWIDFIKPPREDGVGASS